MQTTRVRNYMHGVRSVKTPRKHTYSGELIIDCRRTIAEYLFENTHTMYMLSNKYTAIVRL